MAFPYACAITPDAAYTGAKALNSFDLATFKRKRKLKGHRDEVRSLVFCADFSRAVTASGGTYEGADCSLRTWDVAAEKELSRWKMPSPFCAADISADGTFVVGVTVDGQIVAGTAGDKKPTWTARWRKSASAVLLVGDEIWVGGSVSGLGVHSAQGLRLLREAYVDGRTVALRRFDDQHVLIGLDRPGVSRLAILDRRVEEVGTTEPLAHLVGVASSPDGEWLYAITREPSALLVFRKAG